MQNECYYEECKNCINKQYKDNLMCCVFSRLNLAFHKLYLEIPIINKLIEKHKYCGWYYDNNCFEAYDDESYKDRGDLLEGFDRPKTHTGIMYYKEKEI